MNENSKKIILIDQDNTIADFLGGFRKLWEGKYPEEPSLPLEAYTRFKIRENYPEPLWEKIEGIYSVPGFLLNLPLIAGSKEAILAMIAAGHEVRICTTPLWRNESHMQEKYLWMKEHFDEEMAERMIFTKDKTLIHGDILIDDKPVIQGIAEPTWRHIVFDQPYNKHIAGPRLSTWENWKECIEN